MRQGAILSSILFCLYINGLFSLLRNERTGCYVGPYFSGCFGYADDLLLLCPSRTGLQEMLDIAAKYANDHNIKFSTNPIPEKSKTKGIIFGRKTADEPEKLSLYGNYLPWVESAKYLGNKITNKIDGLQNDILEKRANFIERNCEILQEFPYSHPEFKCKLNRIYNSSFPGSVLWDFTSNNFRLLINSWSVSTRHMWNLPRESHRYFIEPLGGPHAKTMIYTRFLKFIQTINTKCQKKSAKYLLQIIKGNTNSVTGRNLRQISDEMNNYNIMKMEILELKEEMNFEKISDDNKWKVDIIRELVDVKQNEKLLDFGNDEKMSPEEIDNIIGMLSTN